MIVTLETGADAQRVGKSLAALGLWTRRFESSGTVQFMIEPHSARVAREKIEQIEGVLSVASPKSSTPLLDAQGLVLDVKGTKLGWGQAPVLFGGPCSVESESQVMELASHVAASGGRFLRGGAFKPRTSPYDFQGYGSRALGWMRQAADAHGLRMVSEVMSPADVPLVVETADMLQVGSRNMQNYSLLRAIGEAGLPVMLKRGMSATIDEWLSAAEYLLLHGATGVLFCERGIRSFDPTTRFTVDFAAVAFLSQVRKLPVIVDPSHGCGRRDLIPALARASLAVGASGVMIETHGSPGDALSDGPQALLPKELEDLGKELFCTVRENGVPVALRSMQSHPM